MPREQNLEHQISMSTPVYNLSDFLSDIIMTNKDKKYFENSVK